MYRMECVKVGTLVTGEIDCTDFKAKLLQNKDKPAIINVNIGNYVFSITLKWKCAINMKINMYMYCILSPVFCCFLIIIQISGTTVKGAVDDLDLVIKTLEECGFSEDRFYIHCDGALFGLMMPFVKKVCRLCYSILSVYFISITFWSLTI